MPLGTDRGGVVRTKRGMRTLAGDRWRAMTPVQRGGAAVALAGGTFIIGIGSAYLAKPQSIAPGFGFARWPSGDADGFYQVKGVRDVVSGLVPLSLLATGRPHAAGTAMLIEAITPLGDALDVLAHRGSVRTALGVHLATAALVAAGGVLLCDGPDLPSRVTR